MAEVTTKAPAIALNTPPQGMRAFMLICIGQMISLCGSGITGFAQGVWVYQRTQSVTQFALISFFGVLPGILISPLAGALVDRWDRRWTMIVSDTGSAFCSLFPALLLLFGRLEVWHIYLSIGLTSIFIAFQWPAYSAAMTLLVSQKQLGRANGMVQLSGAISQIAGPILGGLLLLTVHLEGVYLFDVVTFVVSLITLLLVRIPPPTGSAQGQEAQGGLLREAIYGWSYIRAQPGLLALLIFFAITNFTFGIVVSLITPLALSFADATLVGTILSIGGSGLLAGSIVLTIWGGPKRRITGVLGFTLLQGAILIVGGLPPTAPLIAAATFAFLFSFPIINGCSQVIWQSKVPSDIQGRVFAIRRMVAWSALPFSYLVAGPLAEYVFEPLLAPNGALAGTLGQFIGVGPGRGIGFLYVVLGVLTILITSGGYLYPRLRSLEDELPDVNADDTLDNVETSSLHAF